MLTLCTLTKGTACLLKTLLQQQGLSLLTTTLRLWILSWTQVINNSNSTLLHHLVTNQQPIRTILPLSISEKAKAVSIKIMVFSRTVTSEKLKNKLCGGCAIRCKSWKTQKPMRSNDAKLHSSRLWLFWLRISNLGSTARIWTNRCNKWQTLTKTKSLNSSVSSKCSSYSKRKLTSSKPNHQWDKSWRRGKTSTHSPLWWLQQTTKTTPMHRQCFKLIHMISSRFHQFCQKHRHHPMQQMEKAQIWLTCLKYHPPTAP